MMIEEGTRKEEAEHPQHLYRSTDSIKAENIIDMILMIKNIKIGMSHHMTDPTNHTRMRVIIRENRESHHLVIQENIMIAIQARGQVM
jgi:hypothetical protein